MVGLSRTKSGFNDKINSTLAVFVDPTIVVSAGTPKSRSNTSSVTPIRFPPANNQT